MGRQWPWSLTAVLCDSPIGGPSVGCISGCPLRRAAIMMCWVSERYARDEQVLRMYWIDHGGAPLLQLYNDCALR